MLNKPKQWFKNLVKRFKSKPVEITAGKLTHYCIDCDEIISLDKDYCAQCQDYYEWEGKLYAKRNAHLKWKLSSWDGPVTGISIYRQRYYYVECFQSPETRQPRYFWMYPLSTIEALREIKYKKVVKKRRPEQTYVDIQIKCGIPPNRDYYLKRKPIGYFELGGAFNSA